MVIFNVNVLTDYINVLLQILLSGLMEVESSEECQWVLRGFLSIFGNGPRVLFTDEGAGFMAAFRVLKATDSRLAASMNLLCSWHLGNHTRAHCKKAFTDKIKWNELATMFWKMVKDTECGLDDIDDRCSRQLECMNAHILLHSLPGTARDGALKYIAKLSDIRTMWVGSYTHGLPTYGATTTQRAESVHAALDVFMGSYSTLIACCEGVELYAERKLIRDVAQEVRLSKL